MTKCAMYRVIMHYNCDIKFSEPKAIVIRKYIVTTKCECKWTIMEFTNWMDSWTIICECGHMRLNFVINAVQYVIRVYMHNDIFILIFLCTLHILMIDVKSLYTSTGINIVVYICLCVYSSLHNFIMKFTYVVLLTQLICDAYVLCYNFRHLTLQTCF